MEGDLVQVPTFCATLHEEAMHQQVSASQNAQRLAARDGVGVEARWALGGRTQESRAESRLVAIATKAIDSKLADNKRGAF